MEIYSGDTKITSLTVENELAKVTVSEGSIVIENKGANENARPINLSINGEDFESFVSDLNEQEKVLNGKEERIELVAKGLSGLCYGEFCEIFQELQMAYKVTKEELTQQEISSVMEKVSKRWN